MSRITWIQTEFWVKESFFDSSWTREKVSCNVKGFFTPLGRVRVFQLSPEVDVIKSVMFIHSLRWPLSNLQSFACKPSPSTSSSFAGRKYQPEVLQSKLNHTGCKARCRDENLINSWMGFHEPTRLDSGQERRHGKRDGEQKRRTKEEWREELTLITPEKKQKTEPVEMEESKTSFWVIKKFVELFEFLKQHFFEGKRTFISFGIKGRLDISSSLARLRPMIVRLVASSARFTRWWWTPFRLLSALSVNEKPLNLKWRSWMGNKNLN